MKCFGTFHNDRTCELCKRINEFYWLDCKTKKESRDQIAEDLESIKLNCKYLTNGYYDGVWYSGCDKNGKGHGRYGENCNPKKECAGFVK